MVRAENGQMAFDIWYAEHTSNVERQDLGYVCFLFDMYMEIYLSDITHLPVIFYPWTFPWNISSDLLPVGTVYEYSA